MGSPFERKMMIKLIIFTLASAAMVLGAPKNTPSDPRKFAKAPDFVAPATYRHSTLYANKNPERLDKRSAIEGIPELMTKKENTEDARHLEIQEKDEFWQEAPLLTFTQEQELSDEVK